MLRNLLLSISLLLALPAVAQDVIVVPLDPVDPGEVIPSEPLEPGELILLDPVDPDEILQLDPIPEDETGYLEALPPGSVVGEDVTTVEEDAVTEGTGAMLKGLDKLAGTVEDLRLKTGETVALGWLQITLGECRYPVDNPSGDAYAWLVIREKAGETPVFEGWMIASSPALNALDHARFDVWVIHCTTE